MILSKNKVERIDIDFIIDEKIKQQKLNEVLFIVPTRRKIRYLTRELISMSPGNSVSGLKIETLGTFSEKILAESEFNLNLISEEVSILLLNQSFKKRELKYFAQYKGQIPFGTLERVKNVISEYKRHGITPDRLREEARSLSGGEKLKAEDIAEVFNTYQATLEKNNYKETGDVYSSIIHNQKQVFNDSFASIYGDTKLILINGFDEFTALEIEIINFVSEIKWIELYIVFDYFKFNSAVFSHLNSCHDLLLKKGFSEIQDISRTSTSKFINEVRENLSIRISEMQNNLLLDSITIIEAGSRENEIELIAKQVKQLILVEKVEPEKICVVFNLIRNYSPIIRDKLYTFGIPYNLTDRITLSTAPPVKAILGLVEIIEKDFYYKNIFRALSGGFLGVLGIDTSNILKSSVKLKVISGYENWVTRINAAITELSAENGFSKKDEHQIQSYRSALKDLQKLSSVLQPFKFNLSPDEFRENLLSLIFKLELPSAVLKAPLELIESDAIALNSLMKILDELTELSGTEFGEKEKLPLHFYLNQIRTTASFARYNIPEKSGYGVQITTLDEIRGLSFDYLFIGGLNDGDLPTKFTPEIFFSGSFSKKEAEHQIEQRYLFYQALCTWKKKLFLSFPQAEEKRELVQSSFLEDFNALFKTKIITSKDFVESIYSEEELFELLGKISPEQRRELKQRESLQYNIDEINRSVEIDKKRMNDPFGESEYTGYIRKNISEEISDQLTNISEGEFSATQLENYAKCPYKYFAENVLGLESLDEPAEELEAFEFGSLIHSILYEFYNELKSKSIVLFNCSNEDLNLARDLLFGIAKRKFDELKLNPEISFYEREKLLGLNGKMKQSILYKFLEEERTIDSGYIPEFFELSFGKVKNEKELPKKNHAAIRSGNVKLRGKIDRVDLNKNSKTLKVIDYKLGGSKPTAEDLSSGISLQLPLYLFAANLLIKEEFGIEYKPAGAQIFSLKFNEKDFGKKTIALNPKRAKADSIEEQISDAESMINICLEMVEKFKKLISQGKFNLSTLKNREAKVCKYCDFKRICRIQEAD